MNEQEDSDSLARLCRTEKGRDLFRQFCLRNQGRILKALERLGYIEIDYTNRTLRLTEEGCNLLEENEEELERLLRQKNPEN
jgi:hypothetical protein